MRIVAIRANFSVFVANNAVTHITTLAALLAKEPRQVKANLAKQHIFAVLKCILHRTPGTRNKVLGVSCCFTFRCLLAKQHNLTLLIASAFNHVLFNTKDW